MKQLVVETTCDVCEMETDSDVPPIKIEVVSTGARELDLCDSCWGEFSNQWFGHGRQTQSTTTSCSCGKSFATPRGLKAHRTKAGH